MEDQLKLCMSYKYKIVVEPVPGDNGGGYVAYIPTLGSSTCIAVGVTAAQTMISLQEAKEDLFTFWIGQGLPIPEPQDEWSGV